MESSIDLTVGKLLPPFCILFMLISCNIKEQFNTYQQHPEAIEIGLETLNTIRPKSQILNGWKYTNNDLIGLESSDTITYETVNLPHRKELPNSKMFYFKKVHFKENKLLKINADDGAQVFLKGQQVFQTMPELYKLPSTEDSVILKIVVFNNAMSGGLRQAEVMNYELGMYYFNILENFITYAAYHDSVDLISMPFEIKQPTRKTLFIEPILKRIDSKEYQIILESNINRELELSIGDHPLTLKKLMKTNSQKGMYTFNFSNPLNIPLYYQISSEDFVSPLYQVKEESHQLPFSFSAWGDSQGGWDTFRKIVREMEDDSLAFTIGLGDLVSQGSSKGQWYSLLNALQPLSSSIPFYAVPGNHDYDGYYDTFKSQNYNTFFYDPGYFSWEYQNCFFMVLDPNQNFPLGIDSIQYQWMEATFNSEGWKTAQWRFILLHQPPFSQGWPGYHGDDFIRNIVDQYAESEKIDFVLSGHSHCYERLSKAYGKHKTHFIILGGAGGSLEPEVSSEYPVMDKVIKKFNYGIFNVHENQVNLKIIGIDGKTLDEIVFEHLYGT